MNADRPLPDSLGSTVNMSEERGLYSQVQVDQVWTNPGSRAPTMFSAGGYQGLG